MIVYIVTFDEANKKEFVTTLDPLDHISGKVKSRIDQFDCDGDKKAANWNPPAIKWFDGDGRNIDRYKDPDFATNPAYSFILGPRAAELLRPVINDVAELLPIPFQGETWYFMNVFNQINAMDKEHSRYAVRHSGKKGWLEKPAFFADKVPHAKLFIIPEAPGRFYYAEHHPDDNPNTFKNVVEKNKLFGIRFGKVWEN